MKSERVKLTDRPEVYYFRVSKENSDEESAVKTRGVPCNGPPPEKKPEDK